jgi:hypothetical protein
MFTKISDWRIFEAKTKTKKMKEYDLVIVDVQEPFKKFFGEAYLTALETYCEDFSRVFQIYDTKKISEPDYLFPNQTLTIAKEYGGELDEQDVEYYFTEPMRDAIYQKFQTGFQERDMFETINGDYFIYVDGAHKWFLCHRDMADLFRGFKTNGRKIILVGGAANECLKDIYVTMRAFDVNVEYNAQYVYSAKGSQYQKIDEKLGESSRADLYHAITTDLLISALEKNSLDTYTMQRVWPDGKRRKDDESDYMKSHYIKGISLTRDILYAKKWNECIIVFDQVKLLHKYKLMPYNWGYSIGGGYNQGHRVKQEREEFLITTYIRKALTNIQHGKAYEKAGNPIGPLDRFMKGFYISKEFGTADQLDFLRQHPLYLGKL